MLRTLARASITFALSLLAASEAAAIAGVQRTFVASNGNDANPCSIALPCRSFASAIGLLISGGEVIVLDSAGYGPVTITQSASIIAPAGVYAGISVPAGGTGVAITGAGVNVTLHGLSINSTGGDYGIQMTNGAELAVENCVISNFTVAQATGISIATAAMVKISETVVRDSQYGIIVGYGATANITHSQVIKNNIEGIEIYGGPPGTTTNVYIADTLVTGNGIGGSTFCVDNYASSGTIGNMSATRVTVTDCAEAFENEPFSGGTMTVSNSMVTGNSYGFYRLTGTFYSLGTSQVGGNTFDTQGVITTIGGK